MANEENTTVQTTTIITSPGDPRIMIPSDSTTTKKQMLLFLGGGIEGLGEANYRCAIEQGWLEELGESKEKKENMKTG